MKRIFKLGLMLSLVMALTACKQSGQVKEIDFEATMSSIVEQAQNQEIVLGMLSENLDETTLKELYNINPAHLEKYEVRTPMMMIQSNEIAMFKVKDDNMVEVKQGVEKRVADLKEIWSRYLPDQYDLVENYQTYENGDYYFMVISEDADKIMSQIKDAFK